MVMERSFGLATRGLKCWKLKKEFEEDKRWLATS
jgi:hypothetical protein